MMHALSMMRIIRLRKSVQENVLHRSSAITNDDGSGGVMAALLLQYIVTKGLIPCRAELLMVRSSAYSTHYHDTFA